MATTLPRQIATTLRTSPNALIACHVSPDGDCIGASLALALALNRLGVRAVVGSADGVPKMFTDLPGAAEIMTVPPVEAFTTAVAMECSTVDRAGAFAEALQRARTLINIDHHLSNAGYGHLVYWDTSAAAVGEQITEIIRALGTPIDAAIAQCLLAALVTDTGAFRYPNVTPHALRLAAELVEAGGSIHRVVDRVYETRSPGSLKLLGMALASVRLSADGRVAWTVVMPEMMAASGALPEDTTGIVGMLRAMRGVKVALMFEVTPDGIRASIRSRDGARSNVIAETFGGGGHQGAAGFTLPGTLDDVVMKALAVVDKELHEADGAQPPTTGNEVTRKRGNRKTRL